MAKAPLKNGQPLTFEAKDPNGSLLNGLKSKKPSIKVSKSTPGGVRRPLLTYL